MADIQFVTVRGAEKETFVAIELAEGLISKTWFMSEAELRERLKGALEADIEAKIQDARRRQA